ncbi:MAG: hypothetical protein IIC60_08530 [Proteobacteria bacterium]|nr:hypothetical protein [Pseudomonadota bacterium]
MFKPLVLLLFIGLLWIDTSLAEINSIRVSSRLDPNSITITEVDIVFIYDADIASNFPSTKSAWYSGKFMFTRTAGAAIDIVNIFIPQGFDFVDAILPERKDQAIRVVVFTQHDDSKAQPIDITELVDVLVEIDPFGIIVSSTN